MLRPRAACSRCQPWWSRSGAGGRQPQQPPSPGAAPASRVQGCRIKRRNPLPCVCDVSGSHTKPLGALSCAHSCLLGMVTTAWAVEPPGSWGGFGASAPWSSPSLGGVLGLLGLEAARGAAASPETLEGAGRERRLRLQPCQAGWWHSPSPAPGVPVGIEGHRGAPAPGVGQGRRSLEAVAETEPKCWYFSQIGVISPVEKREMMLVFPSSCPTGTGAPPLPFWQLWGAAPEPPPS